MTVMLDILFVSLQIICFHLQFKVGGILCLSSGGRIVFTEEKKGGGGQTVCVCVLKKVFHK